MKLLFCIESSFRNKNPIEFPMSSKKFGLELLGEDEKEMNVRNEVIEGVRNTYRADRSIRWFPQEERQFRNVPFSFFHASYRGEDFCDRSHD